MCLVMFIVIVKDYKIYSSHLNRLCIWCLHQAVDVISRIIKIKLCVEECKYSDHRRKRIDKSKHHANQLVFWSWCCFALIVGTDFHFCYKQSYFINFGSSKVGAETYGINSDTLWGNSSRCSTSKGKGNVLDEIET